MTMGTFAGWAAHLLTVEADIKLAEEVAVVKACELISETAQEMIGHPHPFWPPLAPETIAHKAHGDTPLLETGELRSSISWDAPHHEGRETVGYVGSDNMKAVYHELGTVRIPPRPFLSTAAAQQEEKIVEMAGKLIEAALIHGGPNYHELKMLMHVLHHVWQETKKFGRQLTKEPDE
jgi:HK97 gp10 family phage protein